MTVYERTYVVSFCDLNPAQPIQPSVAKNGFPSLCPHVPMSQTYFAPSLQQLPDNENHLF
jgi:hypothetical protein